MIIIYYLDKPLNKSTKEKRQTFLLLGGLGVDVGGIDLPSLGVSGGEGGSGLDLGGVELPGLNLGGDAGIGLDLGGIDLPGLDLGGEQDCAGF